MCVEGVQGVCEGVCQGVVCLQGVCVRECVQGVVCLQEVCGEGV